MILAISNDERGGIVRERDRNKERERDKTQKQSKIYVRRLESLFST
jgi:hypothetical protein